MKTLKTIPTFKDEDAERDFWAKEDSTEYLDWSKAERVTLPKLPPRRPAHGKTKSGGKRAS
jgi:CopG antitoxin of type II toxin-antitoxin system